MSAASVTPMFSGELRFLSNFDTTPFWMPLLNTRVRSGEHAFNALKTLDPAARNLVLHQPTPGMAKHAGRRVALRPDWDSGVRVAIMRAVVQAKFAPSSELMELLQSTGGQVLVETNVWHDNFWGDCHCGRPDLPGSRLRQCSAPGVNMLGELLMAQRAEGGVPL